ncbi:hypothetical protein TGVAND_268350 [Toxoplasma gondii VAND]|uniref:WD domain, G-beta repeat-containing protein n=1 Tax=Toxoplasma gondii VAND TaxID=933077 RepID=A0A086Q0V4_TOXGO|nr:hypothetical protein TGVAND_268350 [Toxoplasma gondii VAND]
MRVAPLLTLRGCTPGASPGSTVGAAAFLSPARLALGDSEGRVSLFDLDTRRPCLLLPEERSRSTSRAAGLRAAVGSTSWEPSPTLLLEGLGARAELSHTSGAGAGWGHDLDREDRDSSGVDKLLSQQRSSAVTLWDLETLQEIQSFRTGSFSFCRLAVLGQPHCRAEETEKKDEESDEDLKRGGVGGSNKGRTDTSVESASTCLETSALSAAFASLPSSSCSPAFSAPWSSPSASQTSSLPLLACPVADAEAIGVFDLRVSQTGAVGKPVLLLRSPFASSSVPKVPTPPSGMVQGIAHVPRFSSPHIIAAYELPCVALWDLRQSRSPLSAEPLSSSLSSSLSSPSASSLSSLSASSPPSALTVHRNQCWVGCFDGQVFVWKLRNNGALSLRKTLHLFADKAPEGSTGPSLASHSSPCLPHPEGDLARSRLLVSAAFRPDGALVAVGASDGGVRLFETKSGRFLGSLEASGHAGQGDMGGAASVLAWCPRTGVLASGGGVGGRVALWGLYAETFRQRTR